MATVILCSVAFLSFFQKEGRFSSTISLNRIFLTLFGVTVVLNLILTKVESLSMHIHT